MDKFYFRRKRFQEFISRCGVTPDTFILDVGGLPADWVRLEWPGKVLCLSLSLIDEGYYGKYQNIEYRRVDVRKLPFGDGECEVVYCNSLLEHVGYENQNTVAVEIARVAQRYWVQVPYRYFFLEPHYKFPYYHAFPLPVRKFIVRYWTQGILRSHYYADEVETLHLPAKREFRALFPDALHSEERFLLHTKSLIACRPDAPSQHAPA